MNSLLPTDSPSSTRLRAAAAATTATSATLTNATPAVSFSHRQLPCLLLSRPAGRLLRVSYRRALSSSAVSASGTLMASVIPPKNGVYTVGDFMTKKDELRVVKPTTTVDEALETLVEHRITGFPVIDDDWKLVGLVSDYDLLALDTISAGQRADSGMFPEVDSTWKTFNEIQKLLSKTNGKLVGDLMTPAPMVVRETTNIEDAARLLLETKFRRLPVVDSEGKLVRDVFIYSDQLISHFL
ncbi:unnamed protein product [Linum tenue]|uniref:CBS domain-containing protein n=1 Tax=Linum tenue TaxID=586396 RepID=A0AAV0L7Y2_9ROSI|nr:unnamed protein product [Linum tenue]